LPSFGQYILPFSESFEAITFPGTEWGIENQGGNTWVQNTIAAKTGTNSIYINNFGGGNPAGSTDVFVTPSYDLTVVTNSIMTFELAFANTVSTSDDRLKVFASTTCGQLWAIRYNKAGAALATADTVTTQFVPTATDWETQTVNIASVSYNNKPNVRFKFEYTHDAGNDIFIDDINVNGTIGLNEVLEQALQMNIYPNPASTVATISFTLDKNYKIFIDVIDVMGRQVNTISETYLEAGEYQFELPGDLSNGLYNVRVFVDDQVLSRKVLISR
jgi:hypothetical protein